MNNHSFIATLIGIFVIVAAVIVPIALTYLAISGLWYLVCLGLGIEFSWFAALGIFAIGMILRWIVSAAKN